MYENHFGLQQRPFRSTPDSECYYPATSHEQALARLAQAIAEDEGLALLTGAPGLGKTLLCHRLLERLGENVATAFLTHSHFVSRAGMLQAILFDLDQPYAQLNEQELRLALTDFLVQNFAAGKKTVLIMDEAQNLTPDLLEELRLLCNLEARHGKAFQVVLFAQPRFLDLLGQPELAVFQQRLAVRAALQPLDVHEAADYLLHQVRSAGGQPEALLTDEAVELLAKSTQGVPRLLNRAAHQAFALAQAAEATCVEMEAALEALAVLGLATEEEMLDAAQENEHIFSAAAGSAVLSAVPLDEEGELSVEGDFEQEEDVPPSFEAKRLPA